MLSKKTRKRVQEHNWNEHSNTSQFFQRLKQQADTAINDLTLLASKLDEKQLQEIFTVKKLEPFIRALIRVGKDRDRNFMIGHMLLKWSLNYTGAMLDNKWAKELYQQHEVPLRDMLEILYHERRRKMSGEVQHSLVE